MKFKKLTQRLKSLFNRNNEYYYGDGRSDVIIYKNGRKSIIEYWEFIDKITSNI